VRVARTVSTAADQVTRGVSRGQQPVRVGLGVPAGVAGFFGLEGPQPVATEVRPVVPLSFFTLTLSN
jgi:hypothetical protein